MNPISFNAYIPKEILGYIFNYLKDVPDQANLSQVCKYWQEIALTTRFPSLTQCLSLRKSTCVTSFTNISKLKDGFLGEESFFKQHSIIDTKDVIDYSPYKFVRLKQRKDFFVSVSEIGEIFIHHTPTSKCVRKINWQQLFPIRSIKTKYIVDIRWNGNLELLISTNTINDYIDYYFMQIEFVKRAQ